MDQQLASARYATQALTMNINLPKTSRATKAAGRVSLMPPQKIKQAIRHLHHVQEDGVTSPQSNLFPTNKFSTGKFQTARVSPIPPKKMPSKSPPISTGKLEFGHSVCVRKSFDSVSKVKSSCLFRPMNNNSPLQEKLG